jgi:phosphoenolpyruvate carboxylase
MVDRKKRQRGGQMLIHPMIRTYEEVSRCIERLQTYNEQKKMEGEVSEEALRIIPHLIDVQKLIPDNFHMTRYEMYKKHGKGDDNED